MDKITSKTSFSHIKQYVRVVVLAKKERFTRNEIMVKIGEVCEEDVPYETYKKAVDEVLDELVDFKNIVKVNHNTFKKGNKGLVENNQPIVEGETSSYVIKSKKLKSTKSVNVENDNRLKLKHNKPIEWPFIPDEAIIDDEF